MKGFLVKKFSVSNFKVIAAIFMVSENLQTVIA